MSSLGLEEVVVFRRDTPPFEWVLTDEDAEPLDLDGFTAKLSAKWNLEDADGDAVFDVDVDLDEAGSVARVTLTEDDLAADGRLVCELRLLKVGPPAVEWTVHQFLLIVRKDVL